MKDPFRNLTWNEYIQLSILSGPIYSASDIIGIVPIWTEDFCNYVEEIFCKMGTFSPLKEDYENNTAPGQECRLNTVSPQLSYLFKRHILTFLQYPISNFYRKYDFFDRGYDSFREPFLVKYTKDTQTTMDEHHDNSLLSFSMVLSNPKNYEGSNLFFPRQNFNNKEIPRGYAVMFPGCIGAPHYVDELKFGRRVGLTSWVKGGDLYNTGV